MGNTLQLHTENDHKSKEALRRYNEKRKGKKGAQKEGNKENRGDSEANQTETRIAELEHELKVLREKQRTQQSQRGVKEVGMYPNEDGQNWRNLQPQQHPQSSRRPGMPQQKQQGMGFRPQTPGYRPQSAGGYPQQIGHAYPQNAYQGSPNGFGQQIQMGQSMHVHGGMGNTGMGHSGMNAGMGHGMGGMGGGMPNAGMGGGMPNAGMGMGHGMDNGGYQNYQGYDGYEENWRQGDTRHEEGVFM